jgi:mannose-6-phosphate isomerase
MTREEFKTTLTRGTIADHVHKIRVKAGDAMFLPAGRFHAVGAGNLLVEIQQNSDTTYRVFDWNRSDNSETPRQLHVDEALQSIDFNDSAPNLVQPRGELLAKDDLFEIQKWDLSASREIAPGGQFAIVFCITGGVQCADIDLAPGDFSLVPASLPDRQVKPVGGQASLLRVTL